MTEYKIKVSIDEKNFFFVVVKTDFRPAKVVWNPTEDDLQNAIVPRSYNRTNICPRCREDNEISDKSILCPGQVNHDTDKNGEKTGEWVCKIHGSRRYHRYYPGSDTNIKKSLTNRRMGNINPNSCSAIGDNFEELTSQWKGVKILSVENDCYNGPLDHSADSEGRIPQTKGKFLNAINQLWNFGNLEKEWGKKFDYEICYCASKDENDIEKIYEFPKEEITVRKGINILNDDNIHWYDQYEIRDEEILKYVNKLWKKIIKAEKELDGETTKFEIDHS